MNNLKEDLKRLARKRREIFKDIDLNKIIYSNREAQGKITKTYEKLFFKTMKKLNNGVKEIEVLIEEVFNKGLEKGFSVEDMNTLILQGLSELDLEEATF